MGLETNDLLFGVMDKLLSESNEAIYKTSRLVGSISRDCKYVYP